MNFEFKKVLVKDTREEGKTGGEYKEFEMGEEVEVISDNGRIFQGCVCEITPVFLEILDDDGITHSFWFTSLRDIKEIAR